VTETASSVTTLDDRQFGEHDRRAAQRSVADHALAGLGKITHSAVGTGAPPRCYVWAAPYGSGAVVRLPLAPRRPTLTLERLRSQHGRVAVCWPRSLDTLRPLGSVRETGVIKLSHSAKSVKVTFALPADETAAGCSVVGDFNGWQPGMHQLRRRSNGTRVGVCHIADGHTGPISVPEQHRALVQRSGRS
jgi:hypothetical protein